MFLQVCPVCEHRNPRGSRFCNECGSPLQLRFCPHCHAAEDVMALECRSCGQQLPMLVLTDESVARETLPPSADTIWQTRAPEPAPFEPTIDGRPLDLSASARAAPAADTLTTSTVPAASLAPLATTEPLLARRPATTAGESALAASVKAALRAFGESSAAASAQPVSTVAGAAEPHATAVLEAAETVVREAPGTTVDGVDPATGSSAQTIVAVPPRGSSIIERLNAAQPKFEFLTGSYTTGPSAVAMASPGASPFASDANEAQQTDQQPAPDAAVAQETVTLMTSPSSVEAPAATDTSTQSTESAPNLQAETESEIAVSAEAETLVEASVAPVTYQAPVEITIADTQIDEIASQFRQGTWRHVMPAEAQPMIPAVVRVEPAVSRRLSLGRVGLAIGSIGAIAATLLFVRMVPGAGRAGAASAPPAQASSATLTATPVQAAAPAQGAVPARVAAPQGPSETPAPTGTAAAVAAASPAVGIAKSADPAPNAALANSDSDKSEPPTPTTAPLARTDSASAEGKPGPAARRAPATRAGTDAAAPAGGARRAAVETPRTCTPAIAALGLCTLNPDPEGN